MAPTERTVLLALQGLKDRLVLQVRLVPKVQQVSLTSPVLKALKVQLALPVLDALPMRTLSLKATQTLWKTGS